MINQDIIFFLLPIYAIFFGGFALGFYLRKIIKDKK